MGSLGAFWFTDGAQHGAERQLIVARRRLCCWINCWKYCAVLKTRYEQLNLESAATPPESQINSALMPWAVVQAMDPHGSKEEAEPGHCCPSNRGASLLGSPTQHVISSRFLLEAKAALLPSAGLCLVLGNR